MAITAVACTGCGGQASLTEHNVRHGWACPHCGMSYWPSDGGWTAGAAGSPSQVVASRIHPTRAAAPGAVAAPDLITKPLGLRASPHVRIASIAIAGSAVAGLMLVARAALG